MRRGNHSKSRASKGLVLLLALVLVFGIAVGGTIAWLTDKTDTVTNTFSTSDVDITLVEQEAPNNAETFQMIPGKTITKTPIVTVLADSEKCYLFVKVETVGSATVDGVAKGFSDYLTYAINSAWSAMTDNNNDGFADDGIYYMVVNDTDVDQEFHILANNRVTVKEEVTKEMMDALAADGAVQPKLSFTAYACQFEKGTDEFSVADAWAAVPKT